MGNLGNSTSQDSASMGDVKAMIESKIASKKVMMFSKSYCPFCTKAKQALKQHIPKDMSQADYEVMEIEDRPDCSEIQAVLKQMTGASSVPRVFVNGKCIGGGDETARAHADGSLARMLAA